MCGRDLAFILYQLQAMRYPSPHQCGQRLSFACETNRPILDKIPTIRLAKLPITLGPGDDARNEALRAIKRLDRAIWKKWSDYHKRSLVETKMHCF